MRQSISRTFAFAGLFVCTALFTGLFTGCNVDIDTGGATASGPTEAERQEAAVERARGQVQMLDDIYKTTVVLITDKYVHDETDFPAGSAAVALFDAISKKGSHQVRLIDVTGQPIIEENVAVDEFEKEGVVKLKEGETYYDEVTEVDGKSTLRAMTAVPVVMEKCIMCHSHYADVPDGAAIGAISYSVPIQ